MMFKGLPESHRTVWGIRDWSAWQEVFINIFIIETTPLIPGETRTYNIHTVPSGKRSFVAGLIQSFECRMESHSYIFGGPSMFKGYKEEFLHSFGTYAPTMVFPKGTVIKIDFKNVDIVSGRFSVIWQGFELPASSPENPKNPSPKERFRVKDFTYCTKYFLPNNEVLILFYKGKEGKRNLLWIKDHGTKSEKVLGQNIMDLDKTNEIITTIMSSPKSDELKNILNKIKLKN